MAMMQDPNYRRMYSQMMQNPAVREMVMNMMRNPQFVQQVIQLNPDLANNPAMTQAVSGFLLNCLIMTDLILSCPSSLLRLNKELIWYEQDCAASLWSFIFLFRCSRTLPWYSSS